MTSDAQRTKLGLPVRPFFYTFEQLSQLMSVDQRNLERFMVHYKGRSVGAPPRDKLAATNLSPEGEMPQWRVEEKDLIRWMRFKGINFANRGF